MTWLRISGRRVKNVLIGYKSFKNYRLRTLTACLFKTFWNHLRLREENRFLCVSWQGWSAWQDLNLRPLAPQASALPVCATRRYILPSQTSHLRFWTCAEVLESLERGLQCAHESPQVEQKLEALFARGSSNTRAKDIFDMSLVFKLCTNKKKLRKAIEDTFKGRGTKIPDSFHLVAKEYDLDLLKRAWTAVEQMGTKVSFETSWRTFLSVLRALDSWR